MTLDGSLINNTIRYPGHDFSMTKYRILEKFLNMHLMVAHINPLNAELNPICHLLALQGGATVVDVSRLRVKKGATGEAICYSKGERTCEDTEEEEEEPWEFSRYVGCGGSIAR
jgi:hypothetical protein